MSHPADYFAPILDFYRCVSHFKSNCFCELFAINNSIDSNNASDNDFAPFLNIMNEWYAKDTSNKIKAVFDARMKDGKRCSGSIPYGYNRLPNDKQTLVVDPVASEVVKHIFFLRTKEKARGQSQNC